MLHSQDVEPKRKSILGRGKGKEFRFGHIEYEVPVEPSSRPLTIWV